MKNIPNCLMIFFLCVLISGCGTAPVSKAQKIDPGPLKTLEKGKEARPFQLGKVIFGLEKGKVIGTAGNVLFGMSKECVNKQELKWEGGVFLPDEALLLLSEVFFKEFNNAGYPVKGDPRELFPESGSAGPDLIVGAKIIDWKQASCFSGQINGRTKAKSDMYLEILWQFFSVQRNEVVFEITTSNNVVEQWGSTVEIFLKTFGENVKSLASKQEFYDFITLVSHKDKA